MRSACRGPACSSVFVPCRVYHSLDPPSYDLGSIAAPPLAIFYGGRDKLADVQDVGTLLRALPAEAVVYTQVRGAFGQARTLSR